MLFNSYQFIFIFLPITFCVYFLINYYKKYVLATGFLALASVFFYAFGEYKHLWILLLSICFNYFISGLILRFKDSKNIESKKPLILLIIALVFNISLLCYFKYMDFFIESFNAIFHTNIALLKIVLPLGISFFTITQIAYLVDCYLGRAVERNIINYALFVTFFPHLIAGPILHHAEMMPQFSLLRNKIIRYDNIAKGLFIFSIGLFKKVFIADSFAKWANAGYSALDSGITLNIFEAWATSLSYTFQLYFDFSGYCDMAIGLGLLFNIALPINFASPYKSLNIAEFWRRWHITLGRFLRDYIYIPLGGNRNFRTDSKNTDNFRADSIESSLKKHADSKSILNKILTLRNLFIVAFISGIWHGAGLGFVIWGILHGLAMCIHRIYRYLLETFFNIRLKDSKINVNYLDSNADTKARNLPYSPVLTSSPTHPTHLEKIAQENRANFNQNTESNPSLSFVANLHNPTAPTLLRDATKESGNLESTKNKTDSIESKNSQNLDSKQITETNTIQNLDSTNSQNLESKTQDSKETAESSGRAGNEIQSETLRQISTNQTLNTDSIETNKLQNLDSKDSKNTESNNSQKLDSIKNTESTLQDSINSSKSQNLDSTNAQITESTPSKSPKIQAFIESKIYKIACWFITFNFINITWIFFRAENLSSAITLIKSMFLLTATHALESKWWKNSHIFESTRDFRTLIYMLLFALLLVFVCKNSITLLRNFNPQKNALTFCGYLAFMWVILCYSLYKMLFFQYSEFIYFNF